MTKWDYFLFGAAISTWVTLGMWHLAARFRYRVFGNSNPCKLCGAPEEWHWLGSQRPVKKVR